MFCTTLLPKEAVIKPVGGSGKAFWAAGKNWDIMQDGLTDENLALMGRWRVEVAPATANKKDLFLHVIQVGSKSLTEASQIELIESGDTYGARIEVAEATWQVMFNSEGQLGGRIKRSGGAGRIDRTLATGVQKQVGLATRGTGQ